jgi:hypothetical protein
MYPLTLPWSVHLRFAMRCGRDARGKGVLDFGKGASSCFALSPCTRPLYHEPPPPYHDTPSPAHLHIFWNQAVCCGVRGVTGPGGIGVKDAEGKETHDDSGLAAISCLQRSNSKPDRAATLLDRALASGCGVFWDFRRKGWKRARGALSSFPWLSGM